MNGEREADPARGSLPNYSIEAYSWAAREKGFTDALWREQMNARNALEALRLVCVLRGEVLVEASFLSTSTIAGGATESGLSLLVTSEG